MLVLLALGAPHAADARRAQGHQDFDIRVDDKTLEELDRILERHGVPPAERAIELERERARRAVDGEGPVRDTPERRRREDERGGYQAQLLAGTFYTFCNPGEACQVHWEGRLSMQRRWADTGWVWTAWTPAYSCPAGWVCVLYSVHYPPAGKSVWGFQGADTSTRFPYYYDSRCLTVV